MLEDVSPAFSVSLVISQPSASSSPDGERAAVMERMFVSAQAVTTTYINRFGSVI